MKPLLLIYKDSVMGTWLVFFGIAFVMVAPPCLWLYYRSAGNSGAGMICSVATLVVSAGFATAVTRDQMERQARERAMAVKKIGHCPEIGEFVYRPFFGSWSASNVVTESGSIVLSGDGPRPSQAQVNQWKRIKQQTQTLTEIVTSKLLGSREIQWRSVDFHLIARNVALLKDGSTSIVFAVFGLPDSLILFPQAKFSEEFDLLASDWGTE